MSHAWPSLQSLKVGNRIRKGLTVTEEIEMFLGEGKGGLGLRRY